MLPSKLIHN